MRLSFRPVETAFDGRGSIDQKALIGFPVQPELPRACGCGGAGAPCDACNLSNADNPSRDPPGFVRAELWKKPPN